MHHRTRLSLLFLCVLTQAMVFSTWKDASFAASAAGGVAVTSATSINLNDLTDAQINAYYTGVSGLIGANLKTSLHNIIDDHYSYSYTKTPDIMHVTDRDWNLSHVNKDANGYATFDI